MVAMMPSSISFLMISLAGLPMRSVKSRTVMVSAVIYAVSILMGAIICCAESWRPFLRRPRTTSSSRPLP